MAYRQIYQRILESVASVLLRVGRFLQGRAEEIDGGTLSDADQSGSSAEPARDDTDGPPEHWLRRVRGASPPAHWLERVQQALGRNMSIQSASSREPVDHAERPASPPEYGADEETRPRGPSIDWSRHLPTSPRSEPQFSDFDSATPPDPFSPTDFADVPNRPSMHKPSDTPSPARPTRASTPSDAEADFTPSRPQFPDFFRTADSRIEPSYPHSPKGSSRRAALREAGAVDPARPSATRSRPLNAPTESKLSTPKEKPYYTDAHRGTPANKSTHFLEPQTPHFGEHELPPRPSQPTGRRPEYAEFASNRPDIVPADVWAPEGTEREMTPTDRWPTLPDAAVSDLDERAENQERTLRAWQRRNRLDEEQQGRLWSAWPF